jgi:hypothetical protein
MHDRIDLLNTKYAKRKKTGVLGLADRARIIPAEKERYPTACIFLSKFLIQSMPMIQSWLPIKLM